MCLRSQRHDISVVNHYADTVSAVNNYADTFQHSQKLRRRHVSVVNDYADTQENILLMKKEKTNKKSKLIFSKLGICIVVDCADTMLALTLTTLTHVCLVVDYVETMSA